MRTLTIGASGTGVLIAHATEESWRVVTPERARLYASQLIEAASVAERRIAEISAELEADAERSDPFAAAELRGRLGEAKPPG